MVISEQVKIDSERIDDIALIVKWLKQMKDATDDRLGKVIEKLGKQPEARQDIEIKLGRH